MDSTGKHSAHTPSRISLWPTQAHIMLPALWATLVINVLGLALPLAALQIYDRVLAANTPGRWVSMLICVLAAVVVEGLLRLARAHIAGRMGSMQEQKHTLTLLSHLLRSRALGRSAGHDLQTLDALGKLRDFSSGQVLTVMLDIPFAAIYLGLIGYLGGPLVLVPLGLLLVFMGREFAHGHTLAHAMRKRDDADIQRKNGLIEAMERLHTIKAFGRVRWLQRRMEKLQHGVEEAATPASHIAAKVYQDGLLFSQLILASITMVGAPLVLQGQMTLGALMACVLVGGRLMAPIQRGLGLYSRIQDAHIARDYLDAVLRQPLLFGTGHTTTQTESETQPANELNYPATLQLTNLGIRNGAEGTPREGAWLLRQVEITAERGQTIALHMDSIQAGTQLMQTLAGLRPPAEGKVLLNGTQPHLNSAPDLIRQVAYMPPTGTIYRGSIYDNLSRFGQTPPTQVAEMVKLLELESALAVLPRGVDTQLDNTLADPFPPGLKQRLALARVLAQKPRVLLFNHADHTLDQTGYNVIYRLLERLKGKVLLIMCTHHNNLLTLADEHWVQQGSSLRRKLSGNSNAGLMLDTPFTSPSLSTPLIANRKLAA